MSLYDVLRKDQQRMDGHQRISGAVVGVVTQIQDEDNLGRVRVKFPWLSEENESQWARVAAPMAGPDRGMLFLPEVEDEVLVIFEQGDIRRPVVIGALWNGTDTLPTEFHNDGQNNVRLIKSRSGHLIILDDTDGSEKIQISDKESHNSIVIDIQNKTITVTSEQDILLKAPNGKISLDGQEIEIKSSQAMKLQAGSEAELAASGTTTIKGATVNIN